MNLHRIIQSVLFILALFLLYEVVIPAFVVGTVWFWRFFGAFL